MPKTPEFGGHSAVTRSVIHGFRDIGVSVNLDPKSLNQVAETVHVLSDLAALKQAISWKRQGQIKKLVAGPNLVVLPSDDLAISAPEIDLFLVNSEWTRSVYIEDLPLLEDKINIWPSGVDIKFWQPADAIKTSDRALIYIKDKTCQSLIKKCEKALNEQGIVSQRLVYGEYQLEEFRKELSLSTISVFFSAHESQGLALAEAWAMNIPTLVWEPGSIKIKRKGSINTLERTCSSAPYLTNSCGLFFKTETEFEDSLSKYINNKKSYSPRKWVIENLSDSKSALNLQDIILKNA
ncbi:hypothetical protein NBRC116602_24010 [Hyphomicrobiales bacterium 4NK60-0047b]